MKRNVLFDCFFQKIDAYIYTHKKKEKENIEFQNVTHLKVSTKWQCTSSKIHKTIRKYFIYNVWNTKNIKINILDNKEIKNNESLKKVPQQISVFQRLWVLQIFLEIEFFQKTFDVLNIIEFLSLFIWNFIVQFHGLQHQ